MSPATTSDKPQDEQKYDCTNERVDDQGNNPYTEMDV